jgi:hypothetical protein
VNPPPLSSAHRWYLYQKERFPVAAHGLLIAAFSSCAVSFSWLLRQSAPPPRPDAFAIAFLTAFLIFLQLRIADEFKDHAEDFRWRPWRPVPRGLVTLRELASIGVGAAVIQLGLALWYSIGLLAPLAVTWTWLALMTREFFVREWLVARPLTYLWTHLLIIPLTDFYATACDWLPATGTPPAGLGWFIAASFGNGFTLELGRKIRAPQNEEEGTRTYSQLWGIRRASAAWLASMILTAACAIAAASEIGTARAEAATLIPVLLAAAWTRHRFLTGPNTTSARQLEHVTSGWTLVLYLSLGIVPMLLRVLATAP